MAELPVKRIGRNSLQQPMEESQRQLDAGNCRYFAAHLPTFLHWRLFPDFRDRAAFLDIETTGLSAGIDSVTSIALYDGRTIRTYVQGRTLLISPATCATTTCWSRTTANVSISRF